MGGWFTKSAPERSKTYKIANEEVLPTNVTVKDVGLQDVDIGNIDPDATNIAEYCVPLYVIHFCGQTSSIKKGSHSDEEDTSKKSVTLKNYLKIADRFVRQFDTLTDFTGEEEEYKTLLRLIAMRRFHMNEESVDACYQRLLKDSKRFVEIYHKRGVKSEVLETNTYWGCRQQMLAGKVIADWVDRENGPLDPIFGVLLQPTAGRVGPGDTGFMHNILFDDRGHMAYHSAVHDAFGYLFNNHSTGPGYDYLNGSILGKGNPMAGQLDGISFWSHVIRDIETKHKVIEHFRC